MDPLLFIVRRDQSDMYDYLSEAVRRDERVQVILDRRLAERRRVTTPTRDERRRGRNRRHQQVGGELDRLGLAVVRRNAAAP